MTDKNVFSAVKHGLWFIIFFACGLYLLGFSFSGVNVHGFVDALIPLERLICFFLAVACFWHMVYSAKLFFRSLNFKFK